MSLCFCFASELDEKELQNLCSGVAAWVSTASVGECLTLQIEESNVFVAFVLEI